MKHTQHCRFCLSTSFFQCFIAAEAYVGQMRPDSLHTAEEAYVVQSRLVCLIHAVIEIGFIGMRFV
jgi:hypothetical protein